MPLHSSAPQPEMLLLDPLLSTWLTTAHSSTAPAHLHSSEFLNQIQSSSCFWSPLGLKAIRLIVKGLDFNQSFASIKTWASYWSSPISISSAVKWGGDRECYPSPPISIVFFLSVTELLSLGRQMVSCQPTNHHIPQAPCNKMWPCVCSLWIP